MNKLREMFDDESGETAEFLRKCHEELKVKKGCSTCKNIRHVIDYPGFVMGEENECTAGLTCDTVLFSVTDCPKWEEQELKGEKMSDEELVKKVSPTNAILKDVFREEIEMQDRAIKEIFRQTQTELKGEQK